MDDIPKYQKKKRSSSSKVESRSDHKHEYEPCIVKYLMYHWAERCAICGRIKGGWTMTNRDRNRELRRPESIGKPGVGLNDYLSVEEMKEKFPGVHVYEEYWETHEVKYREL